jgi:hypothetical protein
MMKNILHTISGHNFHGRYTLQLRGPAEGFQLSASQAKKWEKTLCGFSDCTCGGGYGDGPDDDAAWIEWSGAVEDTYYLHPAGQKVEVTRKEIEDAAEREYAFHKKF